MKFHADSGEFGMECSHCKQFVRLSGGGFKSWHYALICGLSYFCGCIGEDITGTDSIGVFSLFYVLGFALLWLIMLAINSIRTRI